MNYLLTQFIGLVGYSTLSLSYFKKDKKDILFIQIIAYIAFAIHYYMLSGITGTICNVIGLFALIIIYLFDKYKVKNKNILVFTIIPLLILISLITYQNIYSIFPVIASTIAIISFLMNSEDNIRKIGLVAAICWLIYAIVYGSYAAIIFEVITLTSTIIAFIKNRR